MPSINDIVITGIGVVSPIGVGKDAFWQSLENGRCGIRRICQVDSRTFYGGTIDGFDGKLYVTPRKALKVMNREVQTSYTAAHLAWQDANLTTAELDPNRIGCVYGSELLSGELLDLYPAIMSCTENNVMHHDRWAQNFQREIFPLWMLKNLPNMPACHASIAVDARGPNNTIAQDEVSGLVALIEAAMIIQRGQADVMIVGGVGGRVNSTRLLYRMPGIFCETAQPDDIACRPFDTHRRGTIPAEASCAIVIERRAHAENRAAQIMGELTGFANRFGKPRQKRGGSRIAIATAAQTALEKSRCSTRDLAHVSAQGYSHPILDIEESQAIADVCPDAPVTAFSSYFGTAGAACGLLELAASILATNKRVNLPTLGYHEPSAECPIQVTQSIEQHERSTILKLSFTPQGNAVAVVIKCNG